MFDFLDRPLIQFLAFGFVFCVSVFMWYAEAPNKIDKKTKKHRSFYERWKLSSRELKWSVIVGCFSFVSAAISLLELFGVVEVVGP